MALSAACSSSSNKSKVQQFQQDSASVVAFIKKGDSIYTQKANYSNFSKSMELYDSAWQVASKTNDTLLKALAVFAKGRAYDAINNNPQKTIDYYSDAAQLFGLLPNQENKALYIKHLVAHSYDKVQDSVHCIKTLHELFTEIAPKNDSIKKKMRFTAEMALISTEVRNYVLADSILLYLTKREWIQNDKLEYDYLYHYYLTKARVDAFAHNNTSSPYIDSLEYVLANCKNLSDSMYYSSQLYAIFKHLKNTEKGYVYLALNNSVFNKFNTPDALRETQSKLSKMELAVLAAQRKADLEKEHIRQRYFYALGALLVIISILALFLNKRNTEIRRKKREVQISNEQLKQKNLQNELLNKEIHHRVKNNLQMIMSLVNMQENNSQAEEVKTNMQAVSLRIESIAKLHEQLMQQTDQVDLEKYIQQIVAHLSNLLGDGKKIVTQLNIETMDVPQKISFPLGLIINEWVTNSVKHAKPTSGALEIKIDINKTNNNINVHYTDNGIAQINKPAKNSLGLDIVNILGQQLEASLAVQENNIFDYKLTIPLDHGE